MRREALVALLAMLGVVAIAPPVEAHAFLSRASPSAGSTVPAPKAVDITFTEGVEPAFSSIVVQDAQGQRVDTGDLRGVSDDGLRLEVGLKPLPPGAYTVVWHATSVDTHKTEGRFVFTVQP
jgi:methionine-rich copper-binding protein CopC